MTEICGEPSPEDESVICGKDAHPWGLHLNMEHNRTWKNIVPTPDPAKRDKNRVRTIIGNIEASGAGQMTGPPVSGETRRDTGMQQVLSHTAATYRKAFAEQYRVVVNSGQPFTSEDITAVVGMPPGHQNAVGAQFSALVSPDLEKNHVVYLRHVKAQKANRNANKIGQYQKVADQ